MHVRRTFRCGFCKVTAQKSPQQPNEGIVSQRPPGASESECQHRLKFPHFAGRKFRRLLAGQVSLLQEYHALIRLSLI